MLSQAAILPGIAGALIFLCLQASADPVTTESSRTGYFGEGSGLPGVSAAGAMIHEYAFDLPTARGQIQPNLALRYNSSQRDGEAGYGWHLATSSITRRPLSNRPRFDATREDERYFYDGQPLVWVCTVADDCSTRAPGESFPAWAHSGKFRYFRTQVEGAFTRFFLRADGRQWRVQFKGGELQTFGEDVVGEEGTEYLEGNPTHVVRWRMVRRENCSGTGRRNKIFF
jgi:hypothetical protein